MRPERFPEKRGSKLAPRGDGPFKILEKINDNDYRLELPKEVKISHTFNVAELSAYDLGDKVLGKKAFQEGGNDADIDLTNRMNDPPPPPIHPVPNIRIGPMTRSKDKQLKKRFNLAIQDLVTALEMKTTQEALTSREKDQEPTKPYAASYTSERDQEDPGDDQDFMTMDGELLQVHPVIQNQPQEETTPGSSTDLDGTTREASEHSKAPSGKLGKFYFFNSIHAGATHSSSGLETW